MVDYLRGCTSTETDTMSPQIQVQSDDVVYSAEAILAKIPYDTVACQRKGDIIVVSRRRAPAPVCPPSTSLSRISIPSRSCPP